MKCAQKLKVFVCGFLSLAICVFAAYCVNTRAYKNPNIKNDIMYISALSVMPDGINRQEKTESETTVTKTAKKQKEASDSSEEKDTQKVKKIASTNKDEKTYPISEQHLGNENSKIDVANSTPYEMDTQSLISQKLPFEIKDTRQVQVLIVHTHSCESYMDSDDGYYSESFYPRTTDNDRNVTAVGKVIADTLKENSIGVVHCDTRHDYPSYDGAYSRSYDSITQYLEKYDEIKVVLDVHRDSMTADDMTKIKPTFTYKGKKAAQVMIMTGYSEDGSFPTWKENLSFALKLYDECESLYEGMMRPLNFGEFTYNMNVNSGSLLLEVGTDANTLDEALRTGKMLGNALSRVLQNS